jgi:hypothetical protein
MVELMMWLVLRDVQRTGACLSGLREREALAEVEVILQARAAVKESYELARRYVIHLLPFAEQVAPFSFLLRTSVR